VRFARSIAPLAAGWVLGIGLGCTLDLAHRIACGDGYVDREAGEECDPQVPSSYERACKVEKSGGVGACDEVTCELIVNDVQCAFCGDNEANEHVREKTEPDTDSGDTTSEGSTAGDELGKADPSKDLFIEACDTSDLRGEVCPGGVGVPVCTRAIDGVPNSGCTLDKTGCPDYCGDGEAQGFEECDYGGVDVIAATRQCQAYDDVDPVPSPIGPGHVFGGGVASCVGCQWDTAACSYCGNGVLDPALLLEKNPPVMQIAELCDGLDLDDAIVLANVPNPCEDNERPNVRCGGGCDSFDDPPVEEPNCCVRTGAICPADDDPIRCCAEFLRGPADACKGGTGPAAGTCN
jgi:hypothetical protein